MSSPDRAVGGHPVLDVLATARLIPVVVLDDAGQASALGHALAAGGLHCAEVTFRTTASDSFASGLAYALVGTGDLAQAVQYGAAHGALAMTTPGDTSMATLSEVERLVRGGTARVQR